MSYSIKSLWLAFALVTLSPSQATAALDGERIVDLIVSYMELEGLSAVERPTVTVSGDTVTIGAMGFLDTTTMELGLNKAHRCSLELCLDFPAGLVLEGVEPDGADAFVADVLKIEVVGGKLYGFDVDAEDLVVSPVRLAPVADLGTESVFDGLQVQLARHHDGAVDFGTMPRIQTMELGRIGMGTGDERFLMVTDYRQVTEISADLSTYNEVARIGGIDFVATPSIAPSYFVSPMSELGVFALKNLSSMAMKTSWHSGSGIESMRLEFDFGAFGVISAAAEAAGLTPHALREILADLPYDETGAASQLTIKSGELAFSGPELLDAWIANTVPDDAPTFAALVERMGAPPAEADADEIEAVTAFLAGEAGLRVALNTRTPLDFEYLSALFSINPAQVFIPGPSSQLSYEALP